MLNLGYMPMYNYPDPSELGYDYHYNLVNNFSNLLPLSFIILMIYGIICLIKKHNVLGIKKWTFYLYFIGILLHIHLLFTDSFYWFID